MLSECSDTPTDFSEDLRTLDDLTGRQHGRREDSDLTLRMRKERHSKSTDHQAPLFKVDAIEKTASPRQGGSMDDLVREIKQMTIKKPDPYVSPHQDIAARSAVVEIKLNDRAISKKHSASTHRSRKSQW